MRGVSVTNDERIRWLMRATAHGDNDRRAVRVGEGTALRPRQEREAIRAGSKGTAVPKDRRHAVCVGRSTLIREVRSGMASAPSFPRLAVCKVLAFPLPTARKDGPIASLRVTAPARHRSTLCRGLQSLAG